MASMHATAIAADHWCAPIRQVRESHILNQLKPNEMPIFSILQESIHCTASFRGDNDAVIQRNPECTSKLPNISIGSKKK